MVSLEETNQTAGAAVVLAALAGMFAIVAVSVALLIMLAFSKDAHADDVLNCGLQPLPTLSCIDGDLVCWCPSGPFGNCQWIWVNCR